MAKTDWDVLRIVLRRWEEERNAPVSVRAIRWVLEQYLPRKDNITVEAVCTELEQLAENARLMREELMDTKVLESGIFPKIRKIVEEHLRIPESDVKASSRWLEMGCDAFDFAELMLVFEETFDVEVSEQERNELMRGTVAETIRFIEKRLSDKTTAEQVVDFIDAKRKGGE